MSRPSPDAPARPEPASTRGLLYLGFPYPVMAVLLLVGLFFWFGPSADPRPELVSSRFDASQLSTEPPRERMTDPPAVRIGGFEQRCSDCHGIFDSAIQDPPLALTQHAHIRLQHGMNDRCYNCHGRDDRNKLLLHGGVEVGYDDVELLCAQCHGTTYRDWQVGMHGRTEGSWDPTSGKQRRLGCTECHDPHAPAFAPIVPMPPPNALRQGRQDPTGHHEDNGKRNPLKKRTTAADESDTHGGH